MNTGGNLRPGGELVVRKNTRKPSLSWRIRNAMRWAWWRGLIGHVLAQPLRRLTGAIAIVAELEVTHIRLSDEDRAEWLRRKAAGASLDELRLLSLNMGERVRYGAASRLSVTDAGVAYIVDDFDNAAGSADVSLFNFHGCGTGTNAENVTDVALQTESTTALNPDSTRATGTRSQPAANQFRSVGTLTFDASAAVTEHGIFTTSGTGTGTLLDRSVFSAINVASGDSIQFTYTITFPAGG